MSFAQEQSNRKALETRFLKLRDEIKMHVASFRDSVQDTTRQMRESKDEVVAVKKETQTEVVSIIIQGQILGATDVYETRGCSAGLTCLERDLLEHWSFGYKA